MNWILMLAVICYGTSVTYAYLPEDEFQQPLKDDYKIWRDKCNVIIGITMEDIDKMRKGIFDDDNTRVKDYILCVVIIAGGVSTEIEFNTDVFEKYVPKPKPEILKNYKECFETAKMSEKKPAEILWNMLKCVYKRDPKNAVIF